MIADKGCAERGCPFYDDRLGEVGVEMVRREWVGLTDEELRAVIQEKNITPTFTYRLIARAIEAKLKQKNGYAEEKNT